MARFGGPPTAARFSWALVCATILLGLAAGPAAAERAFAPRFSNNLNGGIAIAGNTLMTCPAANAICATVQAGGGTGAELNNNAYTMVRVDVDGNPSTFDSSSADLTLPPDAQVRFAGLYYGARQSTGGAAAPNFAARGQFALRVPGAAGYQTLNAVVDDSTDVGGAYTAVADVTAQVAAGGSGTYTVANVQSGAGADRYAGWGLIVAFADPAQPLRNIAIFDGLATVQIGSPGVTVPFTGFRTPPVGQVRTTAAFAAYEGDRGSVGDAASLNGRPLQDAISPPTNFFNSTIGRLGAFVTDTAPNYQNQLGYDLVTTDASGYLPNGATSTTLTLTTKGEQYLAQIVGLATELFAPDVNGTKTVANVTRRGQPARPGDVLRYTATFANNGSDSADGLVATDPVPAGTSLVPGSIRANGVVATDAAGDDAGELAGGDVVARLGSLAPGASATLGFDVRVEPEAAGLREIRNVATASFRAATLGTTLTADTPPAVIPVSAEADLSVTKLATPDGPAAGNDVTYTLVVHNNGPVDATDVAVTDVLPDGVEVFSTQPSSGSCAIDARTLSCALGTLRSGGSAQIAVTGTLAETLAGRTIENGAAVAALNPDPEPYDNRASLGTVVAEPAPPKRTDLAIADRVDPPVVPAGEPATFSIEIENEGDRAATGTELTETLNGPVDVIDVGPEQGTCDRGDAIVCDLGRIAAGESVNVNVRVRPERRGRLTETVTVASANVDRHRQDNVSQATTRVLARARVRLRKTALKRSVGAGDLVKYRIALTATGRRAVRGARVCDRLPRRLSYAGARGANVRGARACWRVRSLAVGEKKRFTVTARAGLFLRSRRVVNTAVVRGGNVPVRRARARVTVRGERLGACVSAVAQAAC